MHHEMRQTQLILPFIQDKTSHPGLKQVRVGSAIKSHTGSMHFTNSHCGLEDEFNSKQLPNMVQEHIVEKTVLCQVIPYRGYY